MAESFTDPTWVFSEPHPSAENQIGHESPSSDVINRVPKRLYEDLRQLYADTYYEADLDGQEGPVLTKPIELRTVYDGLRRIRSGAVSVYPEAVNWPLCAGYKNQLYVAGGGQGIWPSTAIVVSKKTRIYAVATDEWLDRADMPYGVIRATSAVYSGKLYVFGGRDSLIPARDTVQIYDLEQDSWTLGHPMPGQRTNQACAAVGTKIHLVGGFEPNTATPVGFTKSDAHWVYDPETDSWDEDSFAAYPAATSSPAGASYNGKLYVFGGTDASANEDKCYVYDPGADTWTALTDVPEGLPGGHFAAVAPGPTGITGIYLMGSSGVETVHVYQPDTNTWVGAANRPDDVPNSSASPYGTGSGLAYLDGRIWKVGGYNGSESNPLDTVLGLSIAAPIFEADRQAVYALRAVGGEGSRLVNLATHRTGSMVGADAGDEMGITVEIAWESKAISAQVIG